MRFWTAFANEANEADQYAAENARDAELRRLGMIAALREEITGLEARLRINDQSLGRVTDLLDSAKPHERTLYEAERDELLRQRDRLNGRIELCEIEIDRRKK